MFIDSIGHSSDFIFSNFSGKLIKRDTYVVVQTPANPGFYWGNYIVFKKAPTAGDLNRWISIFKDEFRYYDEYNHYAFTWVNGHYNESAVEEFLNAGFEIEHVAVLETNNINPPPHYNRNIDIRTIHTRKDWENVIENQVACAEPRYDKAKYRVFKERQISEYRKMSLAGKGHWYGAYKDDQLVGDLGIFHEGRLGRYQNVGTHPDYRRQGICGSLVYESAEIALRDYPIDRLIMKADDDYFAARIYESVGFRKVEINHSLCWSRNWNKNSESSI